MKDLLWRLLIKPCPDPGTCDRPDHHINHLSLLGRIRYAFWLAIS